MTPPFFVIAIIAFVVLLLILVLGYLIVNRKEIFHPRQFAFEMFESTSRKWDDTKYTEHPADPDNTMKVWNPEIIVIGDVSAAINTALIEASKKFPTFKRLKNFSEPDELFGYLQEPRDTFPIILAGNVFARFPEKNSNSIAHAVKMIDPNALVFQYSASKLRLRKTTRDYRDGYVPKQVGHHGLHIFLYREYNGVTRGVVPAWTKDIPAQVRKIDELNDEQLRNVFKNQ